MSCPFHVVIYKSKLRSYKELPVKYCELGNCYRYEPAGGLHGILRPRGFTQDDAHIICDKSQVKAELMRVLDFIKFIFSSFGFTEYKVYLSMRDPKNKENMQEVMKVGILLKKFWKKLQLKKGLIILKKKVKRLFMVLN